MLSYILIDIGTSTIKVYEYTNKKLTHLFNHSIEFRQHFSLPGFIDEQQLERFISLLEFVKQQYPNHHIKTYATSFFRKLSFESKSDIIDQIYVRTGILLNIISQDLESFYTHKGLLSNLKADDLSLIINIGGSATEILIAQGTKAIERYNLDFGSHTILSIYPMINKNHSEVALEEVVDFISQKLPIIHSNCKAAFYTGGELDYMKKTGYDLAKNTFFDDLDHPNIIDTKSFQSKNYSIFHTISLRELEEKMPEDPKWMHGARSCSAIAQAIFQKYSIEYIIPSNSNLINGVVKQQFEIATISGSFRKHIHEISLLKESLTKEGIKILSPRSTESINPNEEFVVFVGEEFKSPLEIEKSHLFAIEKSDALIVCCPGGYVGASAMLEIGYAYSQRKRIIFTEKPTEKILHILPCETYLI